MFNSRTQDLLGNADPSHDVKGVPLLSPVEHHHFELVAVFLAYRNVICTEDIGEALKSIGDVLARCFHTCSFLIPGRTKMSVRSCLHILVEAGHFHPESNLRKHFSNLSDKQVRLLDPRVPRPISAGTALVKMGVKEKGRIGESRTLQIARLLILRFKQLSHFHVLSMSISSIPSIQSTSRHTYNSSLFTKYAPKSRTHALASSRESTGRYSRNTVSRYPRARIFLGGGR